MRNWSPHIPEFQLSLRAGMAAGLAAGTAQLLQLQHPLYAMIATVLVTDLSPSQTRKMGLARLAGTLVGAIFGAAVSSMVPSGSWIIGFSILVTMLLCFLLHLKDAARVAGYVCGIVILDHGSEPWLYASYRTVETLLGIGIAMTVSLVPKLIKFDEATLQDS